MILFSTYLPKKTFDTSQKTKKIWVHISSKIQLEIAFYKHICTVGWTWSE